MAKKERRWSVPKNRAKNYAEERKAKVHQEVVKKDNNLLIMKQGYVLDIYNVKVTMQVYTNLKRL